MAFGLIETDQLFLGLTRPPMIGGVSFSFFAMNTIVCMAAFIIVSDFRIFLLGGVLHGIGYVITKNDPKAVEVFLKRNQKCPPVGSMYGGLNSYDLF